MMRPPADHDNFRPGVLRLRPGLRLIIDGRFCVVNRVTSRALVVEYAGDTWAESVLATLRWSYVLSSGRTALGIHLDDAAARAWATYRTSDQTVWFGRLMIVNLVLTGTQLGHQDLATPGEPVPGLGHPFRRSDHDLSRRIRTAREYLLSSVDDRVTDLLAGLNKDGLRPQPAANEPRWVPSQRTIHRWVDALLCMNVWALMDGRVGKDARGEDDRRRREQTQRLIDEVVAELGPNDPSLTAKGIAQAVFERAARQGVPADDLLGRTQFLEMTGKALKAHGNSPRERKRHRYDETRGDRQSPRPLWPCDAYNLDATTADVEVLALNGTVFRPYILCISDAATGVIVAIWATGHYRQIEVLMTFYEAFQPLVLPDVSPIDDIRVKGMPSILLPSAQLWKRMSQVLTQGRIKPGGLPRRVRCDNANQQTGQQIMPTLHACGTGLSTSRVGRSTDNPLSEATFGGLNGLLERLPGYVGRNPKERGKPKRGTPRRGDLLDMEQLNVVLQEYAYREHNYAPATTHLFGLRHGISRIDLFDTILDEIGEVDLLPDRNALFTFLPFRTNGNLTPKGIRHDNLHYDARVLRDRDRRFTGVDGLITYWFDPRRRECIWVHEPETDLFHEIPSVLSGIMQAPLTPQIIEAVKRRTGWRQFSTYSQQQGFAQIARQVVADGDLGKAVARDYSDWIRANLWFEDALRRGGTDIATNGDLATGGPVGTDRLEDLTTPIPLPETRS